MKVETPMDVSRLVGEYRVVLGNRARSEDESLKSSLVQESEWSEDAAEHLLHLARKYGSFVLRNALAVSIALRIEDGDLKL